MALDGGGSGTTAYIDHGSGHDFTGDKTLIGLVKYSTDPSDKVQLFFGKIDFSVGSGSGDSLTLFIPYATTWIDCRVASGSSLTDGWWWIAIVHDVSLSRGFIYQAPVGSPFAEVSYSTRVDGVGAYDAGTSDMLFAGVNFSSRSWHEPIELFASFTAALTLDELIAFQGRPRDVTASKTMDILSWYGRDRSSATASQEDFSGNNNHGIPTNTWTFADGNYGRRFPFRPKTPYIVITASVTGIADFNLPGLTVTGLGDGENRGIANFNLPVPTITGVGDIPISGIADFNLPVPTITGIGAVGADVTGIADFDLPNLAITGIGNIPIDGIADFNLPILTITGIGNIPIDGIADFNLPILAITGIGDIPIDGVANFNLPILAITAIGNIPIDGTADFNLPSLTIPAIGDILIKGVADFNLPNLGLSATGVVGALSTVDGIANFNLPSLWINTQGGVDIPMVNIFSTSGQTGAETGTAFTLERKAGVWFINRDVLAQIILGSGSATIHIEVSLDGGSTFADIVSSVTASTISAFNLPPIIRVRLSAATAATVNVWLDADLVVTRVNN